MISGGLHSCISIFCTYDLVTEIGGTLMNGFHAAIPLGHSLPIFCRLCMIKSFFYHLMTTRQLY